MGGERMAKRSSFGSMVRKRLSDITNSQSQPKPSSQEEKPRQISPDVEDYINQLIKEKMTLMKLIEERNKIIELSGTELQNLRICLQKLQLQNWNLAQSNSQMLAELNLGRDRVKALQHELVCKDALIKAKNQEKKGKVDINCQNTGSQGEEQAAEESMPKADDDDKPSNRNRRRNVRSQSMGPSNASQRGATDKEKIENKRRCLRRQSARFKSQEREPSSENLFEIADVKFAAATQQLDTPMHDVDGATPSSSSIAIKEETQTVQRSSIGRPLRKAVEKVQSYKEVPIRVKMRRND